ncbi:hypothetical protein SKAU_G00036850 [Synaphobranchus kaupii]|uniref:Uncharacterized protein n=1 Tax=Synaphobranchus kaupii TaxID=118154 RepID=A0A9Q1GH82_SYNKA|nr:hypothetical protein SKAU_G00036850 [Synaphobranchus kaupii]
MTFRSINVCIWMMDFDWEVETCKGLWDTVGPIGPGPMDEFTSVWAAVGERAPQRAGIGVEPAPEGSVERLFDWDAGEQFAIAGRRSGSRNIEPRPRLSAAQRLHLRRQTKRR